jgi:hypothetical protein
MESRYYLKLSNICYLLICFLHLVTTSAFSEIFASVNNTASLKQATIISFYSIEPFAHNYCFCAKWAVVNETFSHRSRLHWVQCTWSCFEYLYCAALSLDCIILSCARVLFAHPTLDSIRIKEEDRSSIARHNRTDLYSPISLISSWTPWCLQPVLSSLSSCSLAFAPCTH